MAASIRWKRDINWLGLFISIVVILALVFIIAALLRRQANINNTNNPPVTGTVNATSTGLKYANPFIYQRGKSIAVVDQGQLFIQDSTGQRTPVNFSAADNFILSEAQLNNNGNLIAVILTRGQEANSMASRLVLIRLDGSQERLIASSGDNINSSGAAGKITLMSTPIFNIDDRTLYFTNDYTGNNPEVLAADLSNNSLRVITPGFLTGRLPSETNDQYRPYANFLLVQKNLNFQTQGGFSYIWLVDPQQGNLVQVMAKDTSELNQLYNQVVKK